MATDSEFRESFRYPLLALVANVGAGDHQSACLEFPARRECGPHRVIPSVRLQPLDHFLRTVWATANRDVLGAVEAAAEKLSLKVFEAAKRFRRRGLDRPGERVELVQPHSVGVDLPYESGEPAFQERKRYDGRLRIGRLDRSQWAPAPWPLRRRERRRHRSAGAGGRPCHPESGHYHRERDLRRLTAVGCPGRVMSTIRRGRHMPEGGAEVRKAANRLP
jgi:hypothetical protein